MLPIEFARISSDGRLTLVIHPGSPEVQTYWAISAFETLEKARNNLREREDTKDKHIDDVCADDKGTPTALDANHTVIRSWLRQRHLDAAVWTGLKSNWEDKRGGECFSPDATLRYLSALKHERDEVALRYRRASEYVRNAPKQIETEARKLLRERMDLKDAPLSAVLFEPTASEADR